MIAVFYRTLLRSFSKFSLIFYQQTAPLGLAMIDIPLLPSDLLLFECP